MGNGSRTSFGHWDRRFGAIPWSRQSIAPSRESGRADGSSLWACCFRNLTAFIEDIDRAAHFDNAEDPFPTIYRVDRIEKLQVLDEHFQVPYSRRFSEGEFRKRVQFMYGGKLETVRFIYKGPSVEAVLDRLSTAEILSEHDGCYEIRAEVFGKGIEMWLRSQGDRVIWKDCPQKTNEQGKGMQ